MTRRDSDLEARVRELETKNVALSREVSERSRTEDELRKIQADLARAQRLAKVGNWRWSIVKNRLIEGSTEYARIHGVDPSEIDALMDRQMVAVVHSDDRERVERAFREFDEMGTGYSIEYRILRPDGSVRHVCEIGEAVLDEDGRAIEHIGTVQDITDLKLVEENLRRAHEELEARVAARTRELREANEALTQEIAERKQAEHERNDRELLLKTTSSMANLGYAIWNEVQQRYDSVSEEFARLFGLTPEEYLSKYGTQELENRLLHDDDRDRYEAFDRAYRAAPEQTEVEYRIEFPGQPVLHVRELMKPVFDESGALVQTIVAIQDITDLKNAEGQLRQAQKMEAVGQLTGGIAHDFNNLLAIVLGNLELLESGLDRSSEFVEWIQRAIGAVERGSKLTQRLLAFSRQQALRPEPVDADKLVRGLLDLLRRTLGETIEVELVSNAGLWLCDVDRAQLENAILNLAINARDAMGEGGRLTIETSNARIDDENAAAQAAVSPGQYVLVAVSDTGTGMPDEIIDHVFEPFFTTKGVGEGSGLGLSMVFGFIKQSSGHVKIYSEEGRGSTVKLYLPRSSEAGEVRREPGAQGLSAEAQNAVVLVVEDDADLRRLIVQMLRSLNYATLESGSGDEALVVLHGSTRVDLLLTDLVLPGGISGRDLGEEAQRARSEIRVLFMSGYAENAIIHQGRLDEGVNFLQKPFRIATVARAIRKMLSGPDG